MREGLRDDGGEGEVEGAQTAESLIKLVFVFLQNVVAMRM